MEESVWNICLTHDPAFAGLYRGINDFARALDAPILSFDDGRRDRSGLADMARRIACGPGWLAQDGHRIPAAAARQAEAALVNADLLVVHSLFRAHAPWAERLAGRTGRPYWAVPHGCLDPWGLRHRGFAKRLWLGVHGQRFLAQADRVVFSTRRALEKASPWVHGANCEVVHWPVDLPDVADRDAARRRFRGSRGIPEEAPLLLFVGRLHAVKRPLETIRAFCAAAPQACHLAVVGMDGDLTQADLARGLQTDHVDRVHITGALGGSDLADAYLGSDGFISLSFQENFGYAAAEAVAYGLPVILSPGHDLAHEMPRTTDGRLACGWLLPDDSPASADQAIAAWATLATGPASATDRLATMGSAGRTWASEKLAFATFRAKLHALADSSRRGRDAG